MPILEALILFEPESCCKLFGNSDLWTESVALCERDLYVLSIDESGCTFGEPALSTLKAGREELRNDN